MNQQYWLRYSLYLLAWETITKLPTEDFLCFRKKTMMRSQIHLCMITNNCRGVVEGLELRRHDHLNNQRRRDDQFRWEAPFMNGIIWSGNSQEHSRFVWDWASHFAQALTELRLKLGFHQSQPGSHPKRPSLSTIPCSLGFRLSDWRHLEFLVVHGSVYHLGFGKLFSPEIIQRLC